uniref:Uncharacterized protein n=1 Tax=Heliothis virescens TaxID=7102 RepID=A0A2A4JSR6_HELVI
MGTITHQDNVNRRLRTQEYAMKHMNRTDAIKDPSFSCRSDIITTSLYCECKDCLKFCCYAKPIQCIDPYLIDMRFTHWIYEGLVAASKTQTVAAPSVDEDEPKNKRQMNLAQAKQKDKEMEKKKKGKKRANFHVLVAMISPNDIEDDSVTVAPEKNEEEPKENDKNVSKTQG